MILFRNLHWRWIEWRDRAQWDAVHPVYWPL